MQSQEVLFYRPWAPPQGRVQSGGVDAQRVVTRDSPAILTHLPPQMVLLQPDFQRFPCPDPPAFTLALLKLRYVSRDLPPAQYLLDGINAGKSFLNKEQEHVQ